MGSDSAAGGPSGPDGAPKGPWGRRRVPYGSVHQLCTNTGQSSDPSSHVGSCRAKSGFRRKPVGNRYGPTGPDDRAPTDHSTVPYRCTTDLYGTIRDPDVPSWDPTGPSLTPDGV